jgi:chromate transporter
VAADGLKEIALLFLRLGTTAFGGPAAHIALLEDEVVRRRRWLAREEFLDLLGATNLIPGPNSTEMAIHVGRRRAGAAGLVVAGLCFILPAALITLAAAWAYVRFGTLPQATAVLYGIKPVVIAIVVQALWGLARTAVKTPLLAAVASGATAVAFLGGNEIALLLGTGMAVVLLQRGVPSRAVAIGVGLVAPVSTLAAAVAATTGGAAVGLGSLFLFFVKVGSVLFGSGYVLLAFLRADLVDRWRWLSEAQLLDAVAVGQMTPGPVFTTATFIGYLLAGLPGAMLATLGIFLPAFVFVAATGPLVPRLRRSATAGAFLDGVNVASLALLVAVTWYLGRAALVDVPTGALAVVAGILLVRYRVNSAWLVLGGGLAGLAVHALP